MYQYHWLCLMFYWKNLQLSTLQLVMFLSITRTKSQTNIKCKTADLKEFCDLSLSRWWVLKLLQCFGVWHFFAWHIHVDVSKECLRSSQQCCWGVMQCHWVTAPTILLPSSSTVSNSWQTANILLQWLFCTDCYTFTMTVTGSFTKLGTNILVAHHHIQKGSNPQFQETHGLYLQNNRLNFLPAHLNWTSH